MLRLMLRTNSSRKSYFLPVFLTALLSTPLAATAEDAGSDSDGSSRNGDWLIGGFDTQSRWISGGLLLGLGAYLATADTSDIRDLGDFTQFVPAVFGLTGSLLIGDREGLKQFAYAGGTTLVATHGLKQLVDKDRPDGSDDLSYPSGHTSASVMGAAYVWRRYGSKWGAPASVLAAYTGISRINGQKHYADDVISGAAIGLLSNLLWTTPIDDRVRISLFPTDGGAGVAFDYVPTSAGSQKTISAADTLPGHYFAWEIGLLDVARNFAAAPGSTGTSVDWRFDETNNPTATGLVSIGWLLTPESRHGFYGVFSPFEVREGSQLTSNIDFGDTTFLSGSDVRSRYVANDYRVGYGYSAVNSSRWGVTLIGSIAAFDTLLELSDDSVSETVDETIVRPMLGARLQLSITERWHLFAGFSIWDDSEVSFRDTTIQAGYRLSNEWLVSFGYRNAARQINTDELDNELRIDQLSLGIFYFW